MARKSTPYGSFHVVTDSMADLPEGYNVPFAPARIYVDGKELRSRIDVDTKGVVDLIRRGKVLRTSGATVGDFVRVVSSLSPDRSVLIITMSSRLSGTYNAALSASRLLRARGYDAHVFDSLAGSIAEGLLVLKALQLSEREVDVEDAISRLEELRGRLRLYMTVTDLAYLARSGRVGWAKALVGRLVGIKPIIALENGELRKYKTVRGENAAIDFMRRVAGGSEGDVLVGSVDRRDVYEKIPGIPCGVAPGVAAHVGPGAFGVAFIARD